jgi:tetratricopeptide (TPR) repeat protein
VDAFDEVLDIDPGRQDAWFQEGLILEQFGEYEEALSALGTSLSLEPHQPDAWFHIARCRAVQGKPGEAVGACDQALMLDPRHAGALTLKGVC